MALYKSPESGFAVSDYEELEFVQEKITKSGEKKEEIT